MADEEYKGITYEEMRKKAIAVFMLFEQDKLWRTREGEIVRLDEMDPGHRRNLLRWLERRAGRWVQDYIFGDIFTMSPAMLEAWDKYGDDREWEHAEFTERDGWINDPLIWLRQTKLYTRLAELDANYDPGAVFA